MPRGKKSTSVPVPVPVAVPEEPIKMVTKSVKATKASKTYKSYQESDNDSDSNSVRDGIEVESDNENMFEIAKINSVPTVVSKPSVYITNSNLKSNDSDRIHLAQAINNFTLKSEQLMQEMKNFESFRESVAKLDLLIGTKKQEYSETNELLEKSHKMQVMRLESEFKEIDKKLKQQYAELNKKLESDYVDLRKKMESDYADKTKKMESDYADKTKILANTYEDALIESKRKIAEDKSKYCELYAKELKMKFIREDEHKELMGQVQKAVHDFNDLKKTFDAQCDKVRTEENKKYAAQMKTELSTMELTHKANNASLQAQVEQQKKEIQMLQQTIESMKVEIKEQRELTKEVAQASSKAQITQTIGKN